MTTPAPTTNRRTYLLSCMRISLMKRWYWIALSAALAAALAFALNLDTILTAALTLAAPILVGLFIALDSRRRHLND